MQMLKLLLRNLQNVLHTLDFPKILFDQGYSFFLCRIGIIIHNPYMYLCTTYCTVIVVFWQGDTINYKHKWKHDHNLLSCVLGSGRSLYIQYKKKEW